MKTKRKLPRLLPKFTLLVVMVCIGIFTFFASANTFEVIAEKDIPISSVIKTIRISTDSRYDNELTMQLGQSFDQGSFGIPQKIKLAETKQHIDIITAKHSADGWLASKGLAQTLLISNPQQKVFGEAVIYLRINTSTTQHLGEVLNGDMINIVTTEGWQLGYQVQQTAPDPSRLDQAADASKSKIMVIMVDDRDNSINSFSATLAKVGERI